MSKPRSFDQMRSIVRRAEARWQKRYRKYGSWVALPVLEAMYLVKALHNTWRTGEAYE